MNSSGYMYVADYGNNRIQLFTPGGMRDDASISGKPEDNCFFETSFIPDI
jgi:hypothetical protein